MARILVSEPELRNQFFGRVHLQPLQLHRDGAHVYAY